MKKSASKPNTIYPIIYLALTLVITACGSIQYKPDDEQKIAGAELTKNPIPPGKALLEFSTNTLKPATLVEQEGENLCQPTKKKALAFTRRGWVNSTAEKAAYNMMNVALLGQIDSLSDPLGKNTAHKAYLYIDASKESVMHSYSEFTEANVKTTCGPLYFKFKPEDQGRYKIEFLYHEDKCMTKVETMSGEKVKQTLWSCTKPILGLGGGDVIGIREIN
jgi:hypothetical protein